MGLVTGLLTLPLAPARGLVWVLDQVVAEAEAELYDPRRIRRELAEATEAFRRYQASMAGLAASDLNNAEWQRDLAMSHYNLRARRMKADDPARGREHLGLCREIRRRRRCVGCRGAAARFRL